MQGELEGLLELLSGIIPNLCNDPAGQRAALLVGKLTVEEDENLGGHGGDLPGGAAFIQLGAVKDLHQGQHQAALLVHVEASPISLLGRGRLKPGHCPFQQLLVNPGEKSGSAHERIQLPAHRQDTVADGLGFQPQHVPSPVIAILGVDLLETVELRMMYRLTIGIGLQNEPVHRFDAPTALDKPGGQPVDELRVVGAGAVTAKIVGGPDQSSAEMVLPDPIDHHPGRQRVFRAGNPLGQDLGGVADGAGDPVVADLFQPGRSRVAGQGTEKSRLDNLAPLLGISSLQDKGGWWVRKASGISSHGCVVQAQGGRSRVGHGLVVFGAVRIAIGGGLLAHQVVERLFLLIQEDAFEGCPFEVSVYGTVAQGRQFLEILKSLQEASLFQAFLEPGRGLFAELLLTLEQTFPVGLAVFPGLGVSAGQLVLAEGYFHGAELDRCEEGLHPIVVTDGDGVVFVIVTAGAGQSESQKGRSGGVDDVVEGVAPHAILTEDRAMQESKAQLAFLSIERIGVAGNLLPNEAVERPVLVERPDHVVPIAPDVGEGTVIAAVGIGIPHNVQPMPPPALAVTRVSKQLVDFLPVCVGVGITGESMHLLRSRGQADKIEIEAPQQEPIRGRRGGSQLPALQLGQDEGIDRVLHPLVMAHLRDLGRLQPPQRPSPRLIPGFREWLQLIDPPGNQGNFVFTERIAAQGHARLLAAGQVENQWTLPALSRDDGGPVQGAALERRLGTLQNQAALV